MLLWSQQQGVTDPVTGTTCSVSWGVMSDVPRAPTLSVINAAFASLKLSFL